MLRFATDRPYCGFMILRDKLAPEFMTSGLLQLLIVNSPQIKLVMQKAKKA